MPMVFREASACFSSDTSRICVSASPASVAKDLATSTDSSGMPSLEVE
jgi:hypothetical protein